MSLDELTSLLDSIQFDTPKNDLLFNKIILFMYEASEVGINNLTYYFQDISKICIIMKNLSDSFPDLDIIYKPNTNYIFIDWS
jgi:hypothetical protein